MRYQGNAVNYGRTYHYRSRGNTGGAGLFLWIFIAVMLVIYFWKLILTVAVIGGAVFLLWRFRAEVWRALQSAYRGAVRLFRSLSARIAGPRQQDSSDPPRGPADYGKIRQYRR